MIRMRSYSGPSAWTADDLQTLQGIYMYIHAPFPVRCRWRHLTGRVCVCVCLCLCLWGHGGCRSARRSPEPPPLVNHAHILRYPALYGIYICCWGLFLRHHAHTLRYPAPYGFYSGFVWLFLFLQARSRVLVLRHLMDPRDTIRDSELPKLEEVSKLRKPRCTSLPQPTGRADLPCFLFWVFVWDLICRRTLPTSSTPPARSRAF